MCMASMQMMLMTIDWRKNGHRSIWRSRDRVRIKREVRTREPSLRNTIVSLEVFIWALPKEIPSAIAISLVGLFLGPMFPMIMNQCGTLLPPHLLTGAIGFIVSFALLGDALIPFATGALADRFGIVILQPM